MSNWEVLGMAAIPDSQQQLKFSRRGDEFSIRILGMQGELMNSRMHGSEEALAKLGCEKLKSVAEPSILVGGLGMGFTLAATLKAVCASARVTVAELVPEVVEWNRGPLGNVPATPWMMPNPDPYWQCRRPATAATALSRHPAGCGYRPEGITHANNQWLYSLDGLAAIYQSLVPEGMLAIWSAGPDQMFIIRLKKSGFRASAQTVRARPGKGSRHTIFLAQRPLRPPKSDDNRRRQSFPGHYQSRTWPGHRRPIRAILLAQPSPATAHRRRSASR